MPWGSRYAAERFGFHRSSGRLHTAVRMSWVTIDRICEEEGRSDAEIRGLLAQSGRPLRSHAVPLSDEQLLAKLRGFGLELDRGGVQRLCEGALSAEEVAAPLIASRGFRSDTERMQADWIWICLLTLWQRWWPERVCLELLDDKMQAGYRELDRNTVAGAALWLDAWADVLGLCDAAGIGSIREFDDRFPMTQSLYNWSQDLQDALWNAGLDDRQMLRARIAVCKELLHRFPDEDQLMTQNWRRALAESYFEVGETSKAEGLFQSWLAADPRWGFGWIGWASCYHPRSGRQGDQRRAEDLLREGYSVPGVRDRDAIAEWLRLLYRETGRAREFGQQASQLRRQAGRMTVSRRLELADPDGQGTVLRDAQARTGKIGRNAPCPCGSGKKFKKCCGDPARSTGPGGDPGPGTGHG